MGNRDPRDWAYAYARNSARAGDGSPFDFKAGKRLGEEAERRPRLILHAMQKGKILGAICA